MVNSSTSDGQNKFSYKIGEKDDVIIVVLQGNLGGRDVASFEQIETQLKTKPQSIVILNFEGLQSFAHAGYIPFTKLKKSFRDSKKRFGFCSLNPDVKKTLLMGGVIMEAEIFPNAASALKQLVSTGKN